MNQFMPFYRFRDYFRIALIACCFCTLQGYAEDQVQVRKEIKLGEPHGKLTLHETWSEPVINPKRWYMLRKRWGNGNNGVVPENVRLTMDDVHGKQKRVLECIAQGDLFKGASHKGWWGNTKRVGGVIVSKQYFASGRFEVVMKIGDSKSHNGGPARPAQPRGIVPAVWTYAYRLVKVPENESDIFTKDNPLYNPYLQNWGKGLCFYWSELDFPEFGKAGKYDKAMYNTFLNKQHENIHYDVRDAADGQYHTYTTEWRTHLKPVKEVQDKHVTEADGYYWITSPEIDLGLYWGHPFKKLGTNRYAVYEGKSVHHWIDGKYIGQNHKWIPAMGAQLNLGVWLPDWAGPAPWETTSVKFASIKVWEYNDDGDVKGILKDDITDNFDKDGKPK